MCSICIFALLFLYLSPFGYEQKSHKQASHFIQLHVCILSTSFYFLSFPLLSLQNSFRKNSRSRLSPIPMRPSRPATPSGRHAKKHSKKCRRYAVRASRLFKNEEVSDFLLAVFEQKRGRRRAIRPLLGHNEHAVRLQRGARCNAVRASLQSREALTTAPLTH